jgi:hypothetical protein
VYIEALEGRQLFSGGAARFVARLAGADEVPAIQTAARGAAKFTLSRDGSALRYRITARRILNAEGAHVHVGQPGEVGIIVADLMNSGTMKTGRRSFSARGTITAAQLTGPLAGHSLADLVAQMNAGGAYVNVHTDDGAAPANTGPGDFPDGEIRGQLRRLGRVRTPVVPPGGQTGGSGGGGGVIGY